MRLGIVKYFVLLIVLSAPAYAAETTPLPKGKALIGKFTHERQLAGFDNPLTSKGFFVLVPKVALLWQTLEPVNSRIVIADGNVRQSVDGKETLVRSISDSKELSAINNLLQAAMTGDWRMLRQIFTVEQTSKGQNWHSIYCADARNKSILLKRVDFIGGQFVNQVKILHWNGNRDRIHFFEQNTFPKAEAITQHKLN